MLPRLSPGLLGLLSCHPIGLGTPHARRTHTHRGPQRDACLPPVRLDARGAASAAALPVSCGSFAAYRHWRSWRGRNAVDEANWAPLFSRVPLRYPPPLTRHLRVFPAYLTYSAYSWQTVYGRLKISNRRGGAPSLHAGLAGGIVCGACPNTRACTRRTVSAVGPSTAGRWTSFAGLVQAAFAWTPRVKHASRLNATLPRLSRRQAETTLPVRRAAR